MHLLVTPWEEVCDGLVAVPSAEPQALLITGPAVMIGSASAPNANDVSGCSSRLPCCENSQVDIVVSAGCRGDDVTSEGCSMASTGRTAPCIAGMSRSTLGSCSWNLTLRGVAPADGKQFARGSNGSRNLADKLGTTLMALT